ncbi:tetratricopeptide repeat protein [Fulvivirga maritima]|uniref:tetratricopeptide repeat protein n=1 Tax=Fulvivirga maritima TaxID=2904247 RepID=UPI001F456473|nr:tetratricopeptide repeat protein [Fulvivirga maritima]UII25752.1 tetratricopeptide repeat protein [Fulvivirga maritima]
MKILQKTPKAIACLLLLCSILMACADPESINASSELPNDIQSIENLLKNDDLELKSRISAYYELYKRYKKTNIPIAESHIDKLLTIAKETGSIYFQARGEYGKAFILNEGGKYQQAVSHYIKAAELFANSNEYLWEADAIHNIADIFFHIEGYDQALSYFQKAASLYEQVNDWDYLSRTQSNIAGCYYKKDNWQEAENYYQKAIVSQNKSSKNQDEKISELYKKLGNVEYLKQNYGKALSNYEKALSFNDISDNQKHAVYINIANSLNFKGDFKNSEKWLVKAHKIEKNTPLEIEHKIKTLNIESELYQLQGQHGKALNLLNQAVSIANKDSYNEVFIITLDLISKSQRELAVSSQVDVNDIFRIEDLKKQQEQLKTEVIEQLDYKKLQVLLDTEIQNHYRDVKQSRINSQHDIFLKVSGLIVTAVLLVFSFLLIFIYQRKKKYKQDHDVVQKIKNVLSQ